MRGLSLVDPLASPCQGGAKADLVIVTRETLPRLEKEKVSGAARSRSPVYAAAPVTGSGLTLDFIDPLTGPEARKRLAQAGYTAPE